MQRAPGLDLLRALAILWVMYYHGQVLDIVPGHDPVATYGWMGVDLFFALSGFLIGGQLFRPYARGEPEHIGLFYLRRLFRTLPPYLLVLGLYVLVPGFRERPTLQPLWEYLSFTANLVFVNPPGAFSHVWSLCVEEQFYLIAPLAVWLLMRRPAPWKAWALGAAIVLGGMALRSYVWMHDLAPVQHIDSGPDRFSLRWIERLYYPTWCRLDGLVGGLAFAAVRAFRPGWWAVLMRRANLLTTAALMILGGSIWLFADERALAPSVIGYPILSMAMAALVASAAGTAGLLGRWAIAGAAPIAAMAYSLYLTHKAILALVHRLGGSYLDHHPVAAAVAYTAAVFAAGGLLYWTFERTALVVRDRLLRRPDRAGLTNSQAVLRSPSVL